MTDLSPYQQCVDEIRRLGNRHDHEASMAATVLSETNAASGRAFARSRLSL